MKLWIGIGLVICGVILGIYVGIWLCFIGGIVDVITQVRAEQLQAMGVAMGVVKIVFSGFFGWLSAALFILPGMGFISAA